MSVVKNEGLLIRSMKESFGQDFPVEELRRDDKWQKAKLPVLVKSPLAYPEIPKKRRSFETIRVDGSKIGEANEPKNNFVWIALFASTTACAISVGICSLFNKQWP